MEVKNGCKVEVEITEMEKAKVEIITATTPIEMVVEIIEESTEGISPVVTAEVVEISISYFCGEGECIPT